MNSNNVNIGIIGLGRIGKVHSENLHFRVSNAFVVRVVDPVEATREYAQNLGLNFSLDTDDILNDSSIDAVVICSPTGTHLELIEKAAAKGKHIFCEKPLEMSVEKIEKIIKIVDQAGVKLQVGFNRRFDSNFQRVEKQVSNGEIGEPHILKITSRDPAPAPLKYLKTSGGMFMDMSIHDFDMARFIVKSEPVEIYAKGAVLVDEEIGKIGDIDTAITTIRFENGCLAVIDNSRKAVYGYDQRLEIFGSKGMSKIANNFSDSATLYNESGRHGDVPLHFFMDRYTAAFCEEMNAFVKAVKSDTPVLVNGKDALAATRMALAAQKSLKENQPISMK